MHHLNLTDFLLMLVAASLTKKSPDQIYAAYEAQLPERTPKPGKYSDGDIDEIYQAYPTHDQANNNRSLGKSLANKKKIKTLLKTYTKEEILAAINEELEENKRGKWLKNFSTFLNNLPDVRGGEPGQQSIYQE